MRKERTLNVAKALKSQLHVTEEAIDTALSEAAHLIEAYVTSRRAIHMSTTVPGHVHENTLKAMMALNTAQQYMTAAHEGLEVIQKQLGIEAIVDPYYTDPEKPHGSRPNGGVTNSERQVPATV